MERPPLGPRNQVGMGGVRMLAGMLLLAGLKRAAAAVVSSPASGRRKSTRLQVRHLVAAVGGAVGRVRTAAAALAGACISDCKTAPALAASCLAPLHTDRRNTHRRGAGRNLSGHSELSSPPRPPDGSARRHLPRSVGRLRCPRRPLPLLSACLAVGLRSHGPAAGPGKGQGRRALRRVAMQQRWRRRLWRPPALHRCMQAVALVAVVAAPGGYALCMPLKPGQPRL